MPSVSITWHTQHDDAVCPICRAIDGYTWTFTDVVPDSLIHPVYGEVWNVILGSLAHEHQFTTPRKKGGVSRTMKSGLLSKCRCHTEAKMEAQDLLYLLRRKIEELKGNFSEVDDTKSGGSRKTTFEDIGVDPSKYGFE